MAAGQNVTVRLATLQDYRLVMAISEEIYSGFDYLICHYKPLLHIKNALLFVVELDGKAVSCHTDDDTV